MDLQIEIVKIKGTCPCYALGDKFVLKSGYKLKSEKPVCMHGLSAIMPFYNALRFVPGSKFELNSKNEQDAAFVQCPDAYDFTNCGCVTFKILKKI